MLLARRLIAIAALVVAMVAGTIGGAAASTPHGGPVYIELGSHHGRQLVRLDPNTFEPLGKPVVQLGDGTDGRVLSPNGHKLAFGGANRGQVYVVDVARFTKLRTIQILHGKLGDTAQLLPVAWPRSHVLVGYAQRFHAHQSNPARLVIIDPTKPHDVRLLRLHGSVTVAQDSDDGHAVFVVAPSNAVGPARLVIVDRRGHVRSVTLGAISAGFRDSGEPPALQDLEPGLAVTDTRALVVGQHHLIASVDLRSLAVSYHRVPRLLRSRLPRTAPDEDGTDGPLHSVERSARLVGDHRLLVTGGEGDPLPNTDKTRDVARAATVVNLRTWRVRQTFHDVSDVTPLRRLYVGAPRLGHNEVASPLVLGVFRHDGTVRNRIALRRNQSWRIIDNRLIVGGLRFGASAAEIDTRTGATIRTLAKGSKWQHKIVIWRP